MGIRVRARIRGLPVEDLLGDMIEDLYLHTRRMAEMVLKKPNFQLQADGEDLLIFQLHAGALDLLSSLDWAISLRRNSRG